VASGRQHRALIEPLLAVGLGPATAASDDVRNLMLSPSAGIDPQMHIDTWPLARQILASLQSTPRFAELSAKFAVQLDGGEALAMLEHPHDLWLSAFRCDGQTLLAFGLAGCPAHDPALAAVPAEYGHELVMAVLMQFLDLARPEHIRMRHLLQEVSAASFVGQLGQRLSVPIGCLRDVAAGGRFGSPSHHRHSGRSMPLAGSTSAPTLALGRLDATMLAGLAEGWPQRFGNGTLRFTAWQSVLLPQRARRLRLARVTQATCMALGLDLRCATARWRIWSRAPAPVPACQRAGRYQAGCAPVASLDAAQNRMTIHLTGCLRSCAAAHIAPVTLLAVAPGHYDLYLRSPNMPVSVCCASAILLLKRRVPGLRPANGATPMIDYIRDGQEIYRNSFAIIRAEANLESIPADLEKLAVRVIHACGMVDAIEDLRFSPGAGKAGRDASGGWRGDFV
jgi:precorrin-3B synthase